MTDDDKSTVNETEGTDLAALVKKLEAENARLGDEAKKAFEKRDAVTQKLSAYEKKAKDADLTRLAETGELRASYEQLQKKHDESASVIGRYSTFVEKQIEALAPKVPKDIIAQIPASVDALDRLALVSSLAEKFASVNAAPHSAQPPASDSKALDPSSATSIEGARKMIAQMTPQQKAEWIKTHPLG